MPHYRAKLLESASSFPSSTTQRSLDSASLRTMSLEPTQEVGSVDGIPVASYATSGTTTLLSQGGEHAAQGAGADAASATDSTSFIPPTIGGDGNRLVIEFCDRCKWLHRATWVQTELFTTFPPPADASSPAGLSGITLLPLNRAETAGRWRVWLIKEGSSQHELVWDRKVEQGFGELKHLKQRIRDVIRPGESLGHSDKP